MRTMNPVKFKINKLGAIHNSEVTLKPFMIFSGESGLGKSYVAFLIHYLYIILSTDRLNNYFIENKIDFRTSISDKKQGDIILTLNTKDVVSWIEKDAITYIGYLIGHNDFDGDVEIKLPISNEVFQYTYDEEIVGLNNNEDVYYKITLDNFIYRIQANSIPEEPTALYTLLRAIISDAVFDEYTFLKRSYILPPSRGALIELSERPNFSSGMYDEFFDFKVDINKPSKIQHIIDKSIIEYLSEINVGDIQSVEGQLMYYSKDGATIPLTAAASSIKELAPLTLLFKKYPIEGTSILFEEPEAHLHPARQIKVADLLGYAINKSAQIQVTTHSDYFIKRLNILMNLFVIKEKDEKICHKLCEKWNIKENSLINPNVVGAYLLKRNNNGTTLIEEQNILDENSIPFSSFYKVIEEDMSISRAIKDFFKSM